MLDFHADPVSVLTISEDMSDQAVEHLSEEFVHIGGFVQVLESEPVGDPEQKREKGVRGSGTGSGANVKCSSYNF